MVFVRHIRPVRTSIDVYLNKTPIQQGCIQSLIIWYSALFVHNYKAPYTHYVVCEQDTINVAAKLAT